MLKLSTKLTLNKATILAPNLTDRFSAEDLRILGDLIWDGYDQDKYSRRNWEKRMEAALNLALQIVEGKTFPWAGCANVAFPLVTIAALQFHSRAYPAIIPGPQVAQYRVCGEDPTGEETQRALRVGNHMSWQLLEEDTAWEEQHDRMLMSIPIIGCAFKKSYRKFGKNTSDLVLATDLVLDYYAKSVETCARKTHVIPMYRNEIYTNIEDGIFRDIREEKWYQDNAVPLVSTAQSKKDKRTGEMPPQTSESTPFTMLEQHCWLDLDGDGYAEPYIATIEASSKALIRLTTRIDREEDITKNVRGRVVSIRATEYFTKYGFIPSADGSVYDIGFGVLLGPLNETVNSLVNQLLDAGTMSNSAGGFLGRGAKMRGGAYTFAPFSWARVDSTGDDLRKSIFPLPVREPSNVLYQLLSLIINYADRIPGSTETLMGQNPGQNTPASTMQTMVDQGSKVYAAIFKRIWRSMKEELKKLYTLNAIYMGSVQYYGKSQKALREDYLGDPSKIAPCADPNIVSEAQRFNQAVAIKQAASTTPGYDPEVVERNFLQALRAPGIDQIYPGIAKHPPGQDAKLQIAQMKFQLEQAQLQQAKMEFIVEMQENQRLNQAKILQLTAQAALLIEQADGVKDGHALALFDAQIGAMRAHHDMMNEKIQTLMQGIKNEQDHLIEHKKIDSATATLTQEKGAA